MYNTSIAFLNCECQKENRSAWYKIWISSNFNQFMKANYIAYCAIM